MKANAEIRELNARLLMNAGLVAKHDIVSSIFVERQ